MTIYIAICDNNIADRKQLERLLEREKDKRLKETGDVLYIESFGSEDALMKTPVKYDIFLLDMTGCGSDCMDIAKRLRQTGIAAPLVLCGVAADHGLCADSCDDVIHMDKPISAGQISHLVDVALEWSRNKTPLIEIRCQKETLFIRSDELIRAVPVDKFLTRLTLTEDRLIDMTEPIKSLEKQCCSFGCFIKCRKELVNIYHIQSATDKGFVLSNNETVRYRFSQKNDIIRTIALNLRYLISH